jgi:hypothetical protein
MVSENPVMNVAAAGLMATAPVTADVGTVEIMVSARMMMFYATPMAELDGAVVSTVGAPTVPLDDPLPEA